MSLYQVLELEPAATTAEIKSAYRRLSMAFHPDRNPGDDDAAERFRRVAEAFGVLGDEEKRARYDRFGTASALMVRAPKHTYKVGGVFASGDVADLLDAEDEAGDAVLLKGVRDPDSGGEDRGSAGVELRWPGKYIDGQRAPLLDRGAKLRVRERLGPEPEPEAADRGPPDRLIVGDNLLVLEALVRDAPGSADLIYIDPPFATGNRFALARRLGDKKAGTEVELRLPAFDDAWDGGLAGFLRMLDPRLRLLHRLLGPSGSLYLHVDPTHGHAVKLLLDEVFGPGCFQREIVWRIGWISGFKSQARNWIRNHDLIFFYVKDPRSFTFNKMWVPHPKGYERRAGRPAKAPGVAIDDVWNAGTSELQLSGRESLDSIQIKSFSREKTGWATQKNESLLRRIIAASSEPGDRVVDVFGGSGTTAVVAAELGRRFTICDHAAAAVQIARGRLLDAGVRFELCELDESARAVALEAIPQPTLRAWMLEQLGGTELADPAGAIVGRRAQVGLALALPGELVDAAWLVALRSAAAEVGLAEVEVLGFDWAPEPAIVDPGEAEGAGVRVIPVETNTALLEASVRTPAWVAGGVAAWERPRLRVAVGATSVELRGLGFARPEHLPAALRDRPWPEHILSWSISEAADPTRPLVWAARAGGRGPLELREQLPEGSSSSLLLAWEDVLGHRHLRTLERREPAAG